MADKLTASDSDGDGGSTAAAALPTQARRAVKHANLSIINRLRSIVLDHVFLQELKSRYFPTLPIIANLRCGAWYAPEEEIDAFSYFKSTDGHHGNWAFSLSRLNLHLIPLLSARGGGIVVDSTRKGKCFPDSLVKTVPIWAAVINAVVEKHNRVHNSQHNASAAPADTNVGHHQDFSKLHLPNLYVSDSERTQIEAAIPEWVQSLERSGVDVQSLAEALPKPLHCLHFHAGSRMGMVTTSEQTESRAGMDIGSFPFMPLVCLSVSLPADHPASPVQNGCGFAYVQGAGDDAEAWSRGLTPALFWKNRNSLLGNMATDVFMKCLDQIVMKQGGNGLDRDGHFGRHAPDAAQCVHLDGTKVSLFLAQSLSSVCAHPYRMCLSSVSAVSGVNAAVWLEQYLSGRQKADCCASCSLCTSASDLVVHVVPRKEFACITNEDPSSSPAASELHAKARRVLVVSVEDVTRRGNETSYKL